MGPAIVSLCDKLRFLKLVCCAVMTDDAKESRKGFGEEMRLICCLGGVVCHGMHAASLLECVHILVTM
jgi:hypothetical protein